MISIPNQLAQYDRLIKLEPESKAPVHSPEGPFFKASDPELQKWVNEGGNVGLNLGELVALDVDSEEFRKTATTNLPPTFTVKSGSGGEHRYYRSEWSGKRQFKDGETDLGSVRSGNWYLVIPPSKHPSGAEYTVLKDKQIRPVPVAQIQDFLSGIEKGTSQHSGGGGGGGGGGPPGCVGGSPIPEIPPEYPEKPANWRTAKSWLSANGLLESLNRTASSDWSGLEFKIAKSLAEGGFSETSIFDTLDRLSSNSKWHQREESYRTRTARKAIVAACNDDYVDFSETGDMAGSTAESRKTESGNEDTGLKGGDKMASNDNDFDYTSIESLTAYNADSPEGAEDGDRVVRVELTNMKGSDENGEVDTDFVTISKGKLREDGDFGVSPEFNDSKSVGSADPDDLRLIAEGLQKMADQVE